jgi:integrase
LLKNLWRDRQRSISQWFFSLSAISKNYFGLHDPGHALGRTRVCDGKEQPGARFLFIMIQTYLLKRQRAVSSLTANEELRCLLAVFNFGMYPTRNCIGSNPTRGIQFFPVDKQIKYVPPKEDVLRVILAADPNTQDYLWTIALTMGRMSEINRLAWREVNFEQRWVVLYTRKKEVDTAHPGKFRCRPSCSKCFRAVIKTATRQSRGCSGTGIGAGKKRSGSLGLTRIESAS